MADQKNITWQIPKSLLADNSKWAQTLVEMYNEPVSFPASLPPSQGKMLHDLILQHAPSIVVEIGCFIGVSSVWIGSALKKLGGGRLFSVDLFFPKSPAQPNHSGFIYDPFNFAKEKIDAAELSDFVEFFRMNSVDFGRRLREITGAEVDFLFIDGDHTIGGCLDDFITFYPNVRVGGNILFHDIYPRICGWDGPRYVIDHLIKGSSCFDVSEMQTKPKNYGMALVTKITGTKSFQPWHQPKIEIIRRAHRQVRRAQSTIRYSSIYQAHIKYSPFFNKHIKPKVRRFLRF